MNQIEHLIDTCKDNTEVAHMQAKGLSHADSLLLPPFRANCMNWVLGHILTSRDECLALLDGQPVLSAAETEVYARGSLPLADSAQALALEDLLARLVEAQNRLIEKLSALDAAALQAEVKFGRSPRPLEEVLTFLQWHETYHIGQLELLRQLTGVNDQVI